MKAKHIWIAVGGSGGHLFPAQVCAHELKAKYPHLKITFIGEGLRSNPFFDQAIFSCVDVFSATIGAKTWWKFPFAASKIIKGLKTSRRLIKIDPPDLVVGFGSFHSLPPLGAALLQKKPYVLFEPNAALGRVNKLFAKKASKLYYSMHLPNQPKAEFVKMPLQSSRLEKICSKKAKEFYGLSQEATVILIFGGSQGAMTMNHLAFEALEKLKIQGYSFEVLHLIGPNTDLDLMQKRYAEKGISACVKVFEDKMQWAFSAADIAVARCGASAAMELLEHRIPSIFVPYPFVEEDHQTKNAEFLKNQHGFGQIVIQNDHAKKNLLENLEALLQAQEQRRSDTQHVIEGITLAEAIALDLEKV